MLTLAWTLPAPAAAQPGINLADGQGADSTALETGQQLLIENRQGTLPFAGRQAELAGFTGVVGYANELAYATVIDGMVSVDGVSAERGWMLMLPPYGGAPILERFDASRFARQWSAAARAAAPGTFASLEKLGAGQRRGVFLGRYGQTRFNVAASGSADRERARRSLLGADAVRDVRFSGESDPQAIEKRVVRTFLAALAAGDAETAASLLDPVHFGGRALSGGAREARVAAARSLSASRDWHALIGSAEPLPDDGAWRAGAVRVTLRSVDDFTFVHRVEGG